ncbi:MAG: hypothetical protein AAGI34_16460 [Pseudomonadota bacterium]
MFDAPSTTEPEREPDLIAALEDFRDGSRGDGTAEALVEASLAEFKTRPTGTLNAWHCEMPGKMPTLSGLSITLVDDSAKAEALLREDSPDWIAELDRLGYHRQTAEHRVRRVEISAEEERRQLLERSRELCDRVAILCRRSQIYGGVAVILAAISMALVLL